MGASAPEARHSGQAGHCRAFCSRKPRSQPGNALPAPSRPPNLLPAIPLFAFFSLALPDRNAYKSKSAIPMALKDAAAKYGPCGICNPPILGRPAAKAEAILVPSAPVTKAQPAGNGDLIVYVTKTGTKYHRAGCRSLSRSAIPMSLKEAVAKRFGPCSICKPPILDKRPQAEVFACCHVR